MARNEQIAQVCHEALRAWCEANGDESQKTWVEAEKWQRDATHAGVKFARENPQADAGATHSQWVDKKLADGWKYGPVKDGSLKTHPMLIPFEQLPEVEKAKDHLFRAVVEALT